MYGTLLIPGYSRPAYWVSRSGGDHERESEKEKEKEKEKERERERSQPAVKTTLSAGPD